VTEIILILAVILVTVTFAAAIKYYKQLRQAQREYEKAANVVENIILSFNRQFKQEAQKLEHIAYKVEAVSSKEDKALKKAEELEKRIPQIENKVEMLHEERAKMFAKLDGIDKSLHDVVASQETISAKVKVLEEQAQAVAISPEGRVEAVIPIKREKALAPLTDTELSVLEMLSAEGPKTAPEIKERVKLSREHTARLMKKLYEDGYLDRDSAKIPFKYSVKKEMEKLLKKTETEVA